MLDLIISKDMIVDCLKDAGFCVDEDAEVIKKFKRWLEVDIHDWLSENVKSFQEHYGEEYQ